MPAWLAPLAISAGSGLLSSLLHRKSKYETSPYTSALWNKLFPELQKSWVAQGLTQAERQGYENELNQSLTEQGQTEFARGSASLARRGASSPQALTSLQGSLGMAKAKAMEKGKRGILSEHLNLARTRYSNLLNTLTGLSGQQAYMPEDESYLGDIGDTASNLMLYYLMRGKKGKPGAGTSFNFMQGLG